jgi:spore coat protein CotF
MMADVLKVYTTMSCFLKVTSNNYYLMTMNSPVSDIRESLRKHTISSLYVRHEKQMWGM